jgi:hypothetical protein
MQLDRPLENLCKSCGQPELFLGTDQCMCRYSSIQRQNHNKLCLYVLRLQMGFSHWATESSSPNVSCRQAVQTGNPGRRRAQGEVN